MSGLLMRFGGRRGGAAARAPPQQLQEDLLPPGKDRLGALHQPPSWACTRMKGACVQGADGGRLGNEGVWRFSSHQGPGRWQDWSASARGMALRGAVPEHGQHRAAPSSTHHKPSRARSTPVLPFSAPCFLATLYSWL